VTFGIDARCAMCAPCTLRGLGSRLRWISTDRKWRVEFACASPGLHNVRNALAAAACCAAGIDPPKAVAAGLAGFAGTRGRCSVDDSLQRQSGFGARRDRRAGRPPSALAVLVLGDMGEVGEPGRRSSTTRSAATQERGHRSPACARRGKRGWRARFGEGARHFASIEALVSAASPLAAMPGPTVLVKGSRFMRMERVADALVAAPSTEGPLTCCWNSPNGWRRTCAPSTSSTTSRCARCWRLTALRSPSFGPMRDPLAGRQDRPGGAYDGPQTHLTKSGTPTMGGVLILIAIGITTCCGPTCPTATSGWC
jgi:hypothetical protein